MRSDCIFFHPIYVRYSEVDQQKIVHNAFYGIYTEEALDAFFRDKGYKTSVLFDELDSEFCMRKNTLEYFASAVTDDLLEVGISVPHIGEKSFVMRFEIYRVGEEDMLVSVESLFVGLDAKNQCSRPLTPLLRRLLGADKTVSSEQ